MNRWVSTSEKAAFLQWFLKNHRLKSREAKTILDYLVNHLHVLEHITFTSTLPATGKTIVISSMQSDEPGFVYYDQAKKSEDPSKVLGEFMAHPTIKRNLMIHFYGSHIHTSYQQLIQTPIKEQFQNYKRFKGYEQVTQSVLENIQKETDRTTLLSQIDQALDERNEAKFKELTLLLKEMDQSSN